MCVFVRFLKMQLFPVSSKLQDVGVFVLQFFTCTPLWGPSLVFDQLSSPEFGRRRDQEICRMWKIVFVALAIVADTQGKREKVALFFSLS